MAQAADFRFGQDLVVARHPDGTLPGDTAVQDAAAGDADAPPSGENLAHFGPAHDDFVVFRFQQAFESLFYVLQQAVDDAVLAHFHAQAFRGALGADFIADIKGEDDAAGGVGQLDIGIADGPGTGVDDAGFDIAFGHLRHGLGHGFHAALDVGFEHQHQFLDIAGVNLLDHIVQGEDGFQVVDGGALAVPGGGLAGGALVGENAQDVAGFRGGVEADDDAGAAGYDGVHTLAVFVGDGAHASPGTAGGDLVAHAQGARLHQHGGGGAAPPVQVGFHDDAGGVPVGVGFQLHYLGQHRQVFQQVVHALARLRRNGHGDDLAAPVLNQQVAFTELAFDYFGLGAGQVHFVDGDHDGNVGGAGVGNGFVGLRHNAVVGGHDQHGDVGDAGAPGADGGEGFVSRRVQKGDGAAFAGHLIGADVLGDAAGFLVHDGGLADVVQQAGFAVVDVTQDGDDRGACLQVFVPVLAGAGVDGAGVGGVFRQPGAHPVGGGGDGGDLMVDDLVHGDHNAVSHQLFDDINGRLVQEFGQFFYGEGFRQGQDAGGAAAGFAAAGAAGRRGALPGGCGGHCHWGNTSCHGTPGRTRRPAAAVALSPGVKGRFAGRRRSGSCPAGCDGFNEIVLQRIQVAAGYRAAQAAFQGPAGHALFPADRLAAEIGAAPVAASGGVGAHGAFGSADDAQKVGLRRFAAAGDAGALRYVSLSGNRGYLCWGWERAYEWKGSGMRARAPGPANGGGRRGRPARRVHCRPGGCCCRHRAGAARRRPGNRPQYPRQTGSCPRRGPGWTSRPRCRCSRRLPPPRIRNLPRRPRHLPRRRR